MRKTKIIATVAPSCQTRFALKQLILSGVDMFRINASHTNPEKLGKWIRLIRRTNSSIPILVDLQGPRVRTGSLQDKFIRLTKGQIIDLEISKKVGSGKSITTPIKEFMQMIEKGDQILLDNGFMELRVIKKGATRATCRVLVGGQLGENKGINLPNAPVTLPALTSKDIEDLKVAVALHVDYIALSFVRSEQDILTVKRWMKKHKSTIPIIAKIEKPRAVDRIDQIVDVSDGIMVARGDLGIELGVEKIPIIQKDLINASNQKRIPVITATQMLESMIYNATPTRAEASDIANAVFDGSDALMLSGETAIGKYPIAAVRIMSKIILQAETHVGEYNTNAKLVEAIKKEELPIHAITHAARHAASDLGAKAILVFTMGGKTAILISKFRPQAIIIALTPSQKVSRRLALCRGVIALCVKYGKSTDAMIRQGENAVLKSKLLKKGDDTVIVSGRQALPAARYMTKILSIGM